MPRRFNYLALKVNRRIGSISVGPFPTTAFQVRVTSGLDSTSIPLNRVNKQVCSQQPRAVLNVPAFLHASARTAQVVHASSVVKGCVWTVA